MVFDLKNIVDKEVLLKKEKGNSKNSSNQSGFSHHSTQCTLKSKINDEKGGTTTVEEKETTDDGKSLP